MKSYRFARRTFLSALGGAFGLHTLLRNMEAAAQGAGAPPRFLMIGWPCGTVRYPFVPLGTGSAYTASTTFGEPGFIISPFATPELKPHVHILTGFNMSGLLCPNGGSHEAGTVFATTGASGPGTRLNDGERDDACAGGPSWDQILLRRTDALKTTGVGYYNVICDSRVDSYETSTRCLSYGYAQQSVTEASGAGTITEHLPLRPTLSPLTAYNDLFSKFMPGEPGTDQEALGRLMLGKSVLDNSLRELQALWDMAPAMERTKIEATMAVIRAEEMALRERIQNPPMKVACTMPTAPPAELIGQNADRMANATTSDVDEAPVHALVGAAHAGIIRAAFACDLIRVATFQWAPGANHVAFKGADPNDPDTIYRHHPVSHRISNSRYYTEPPPETDRLPYDVMTYVQHWYFAETAKFVLEFMRLPDPLASDGENLLQRTVMTAISDIGNPSHDRNGASALIVGGSKLGMQPGGFQNLTNSHHNRVWLTAAQAFLGADPLTVLGDEVFYKNAVTPIPGVWGAPA